MIETPISTTSSIKHLFVMNPMAGRMDSTDVLRAKLKPFDGKIDYEIYLTKCSGDCTQYVRQKCEEYKNTNIQLKVYACGGDGTLCEAAAGIVGYPNVQLTVYACGSGNDYIKCYGSQQDFTDIEKLIDGRPHLVDLMEVEILDEGKQAKFYSLNVVNFGFDSYVVKKMEEIKRKSLIGGKNSYTTGILWAIFKGRHNQADLTADGKVLHKGKMLLGTIANGRYIGGGYLCAPRSKNDDGLMEVCMIRRISLFTFARMIGKYKKGLHLDTPWIQPKIKYLRSKMIEIKTPKAIPLTVDGTLVYGSHFIIRQLMSAICFVAPR